MRFSRNKFLLFFNCSGATTKQRSFSLFVLLRKKMISLHSKNINSKFRVFLYLVLLNVN